MSILTGSGSAGRATPHQIPGCSVMVIAPGLGPGDSRFKSEHPDHWLRGDSEFESEHPEIKLAGLV